MNLKRTGILRQLAFGITLLSHNVKHNLFIKLSNKIKYLKQLQIETPFIHLMYMIKLFSKYYTYERSGN